MSLGRDLMTAAGGRARGDMSALFGLDHARRLVHRADALRLPVNPVELKAARAILRAGAASVQTQTQPRHR
jgi:hypothetical protein